MKHHIELRSAFVTLQDDAPHRLTIFALLNLGMVQSLASGVISAEEAIRAHCLALLNKTRSATRRVKRARAF